jgi:hypothetical protein
MLNVEIHRSWRIHQPNLSLNITSPDYHSFDDVFSEQQELPASSFLVSFTSVEVIFRFEGTSMLGLSEKKSTGLK